MGRGLPKTGDATLSPRPAVTKEQLAQIVVAEGWSDGSQYKISSVRRAFSGLPRDAFPWRYDVGRPHGWKIGRRVRREEADFQAE